MKGSVEKKFNEDIKTAADRAKMQVERQYALKPGNNIYLICEKLAQLRGLSGIYAECGVFKGHTLFTAAAFCEQQEDHRTIYGFDSFQGFPENIITPQDKPAFFNRLLEMGLITQEHYKKAALRTRDFSDERHLELNYFADVENVFQIAGHFRDVRLVDGAFDDTLRQVKEPVAILHLDCDLYQSYLDCLDILFPKIPSKGVIIFDEYYSLKYPGPRMAVHEFFQGKTGRFEVYYSDEGFERWCFVKA